MLLHARGINRPRVGHLTVSLRDPDLVCLSPPLPPQPSRRRVAARISCPFWNSLFIALLVLLSALNHELNRDLLCDSPARSGDHDVIGPRLHCARPRGSYGAVQAAAGVDGEDGVRARRGW